MISARGVTWMAVVAAMVLLVSETHGDIPYHVTVLSLGGPQSFAYDINTSGWVVGQARNAGGAYCAFLYKDGVMNDLNHLVTGGANLRLVCAYSINSTGQIVGDSYDLDGKRRAYIFDNGTVVDLGTIGQSPSVAFGISDTGYVVGYSALAVPAFVRHAFRYTNGNMSDLGTLGGSESFAMAVNDSGTVAGYSYDASGETRAFQWDGAMSDLGTPSGYSVARGINNSGQIVGHGKFYGMDQAFIFENGTLTDIGTGNAFTSYAYDINEYQQVVGNVHTGYESYAFLYEGGAMNNLNSLLDGAGSPFYLSCAHAINDSGQIVGYGYSGDYTAFLLTPIPEPGSLTILTLGVGAVWLKRRRR